MGDRSKIEWTDATWSPVTGCSHTSPGCLNCYAEAMDRRQMMPGRKDGFRPWTAQNAEYNVRLHPERLGQPLKWKKPRRVFVCSISDLFHEQVSDEFICDAFEVMEKAKQHIFQVLTKRPERMCDLITGGKLISGIGPPANIWWGVSAEDQATFDERVRWLLQTPAAVRFVSLEPLLGPIKFTPFHLHSEENIHPTGKFRTRNGARQMQFKVRADGNALHWVIAGGESGPGARPMNPDWVRKIRDDCQVAGVPFFFKQWGEWKPQRVTMGEFRFERVGKKAAGRELDGRIWDEYPEVKP